MTGDGGLRQVVAATRWRRSRNDDPPTWIGDPNGVLAEALECGHRGANTDDPWLAARRGDAAGYAGVRRCWRCLTGG